MLVSQDILLGLRIQGVPSEETYQKKRSSEWVPGAHAYSGDKLQTKAVPRPSAVPRRAGRLHDCYDLLRSFQAQYLLVIIPRGGSWGGPAVMTPPPQSPESII